MVSWRRIPARAALMLLCLTTAISTAPQPVSAGVYYGYFNFYENLSSSVTTNNLTMNWTRGSDIGGETIVKTWRAGSGRIKDSCVVNRGWLPPGWYDGDLHVNNYNGSRIKGMVWRIHNKACYNGTWRTDLFIHSEETASRGQSCPTSGDDPFCWENNDDYFSEGCIKVSHGDIGDVDWVSRTYYGMGYTYNDFPSLLRVYQ